MKALNWYRMTHDSTGSRYGWIIGKEENNGFVVYCKGFSRERFLNAAEMIITRSSDPTKFIVINPAGNGTAYRLTNVYYSAKHSGYMSMGKAFAVA